MMTFLRRIGLGLAAAALLLMPALSLAGQATYSMPTAGPMSFGSFVGSELNPALGAILSNNSGTTAPASSGQPVTDQWWMDTSGGATAHVLKLRGSSGWATVGTLNATTGVFVPAGTANLREVLTTSRTYQVGFDMGTATMTIASPAVVTRNAHGFAAGDRVSFFIAENKKSATISIANPAVVTLANSYAAGQPIRFNTTGRLPAGVSRNTTYYVLAAGLSGSSFEFATTVGGTAVSTASAPTVTISIASPAVVTWTGHGLVFGQPVVFATTGALPTGLTAGTVYYVHDVIDANSFHISTYPENTALNTSGTQSGTQTAVGFGTTYVSEWGTLPTGITAGQAYFVLATGLSTNTFEISATSGGAAINTTGSTEGKIALRTGNDANSGIGNTQATALLTIGAALTKAAGLDASTFSVFINVGRGQYNESLNLPAMLGSALHHVIGDVTAPTNVKIVASGNAVAVSGTRAWTFTGLALNSTGGFQNLILVQSAGYLDIGGAKLDLGAIVSTGSYFSVTDGGSKLSAISADFVFSGPEVGGGGMFLAGQQGIIDLRLATCHFTQFLTSGYGLQANTQGLLVVNSMTFDGYLGFNRYNAQSAAIINAGGGGLTYFPGALGGSANGSQFAQYL